MDDKLKTILDFAKDNGFDFKINSNKLNEPTTVTIKLKNTQKRPQPPAEGYNPRTIIPEDINVKAWLEWCDFREHDLKKPLNERAAKRCITLLSEYSKHEQDEIIGRSIQGNWTGLFKPRYQPLTNRNGVNPENIRSSSTLNRLNDSSWAYGQSQEAKSYVRGIHKS